MLSYSLMIQPPNIDVSIDNLILEQVSEYKFLGVIIDDKLKWKSHILEVITKLCKINGVLHKIRNNITIDSLRQIYLSIAYPHLLYCSAVWGGTFRIYFTIFSLLKKNVTCNISHWQICTHRHSL